MIIFRSVAPRMRNVSDKSYRENQTTHFMFYNLHIFRKPCLLRDKAKKYCVAGQATDDNTAHGHCMQDT